MNRTYTNLLSRLFFAATLLAVFCISGAIAQVYRSSTFISTAFDDMEEYTVSGSPAPGVGRQDFSSSDLELVQESTTNPLSMQIVGLRFQNVQIPYGAIVRRAFIQFAKDANKNLDPCNLVIKVHNVANAPAFDTTQFNIASRATTNDSVIWTPPSWASNTTVPVHGRSAAERTSDISRLVQSRVSDRNWVSGNAMSFVLSGTGTREVESFEGATGDHSNPQLAAELVVEYVLPFTVWNFNGTSTTTVPGGTASPTPFLGNGVSTSFGGVVTSFASGTASGGSSDTVSTSPPNYGWGVTTFPAQGSTSLAGVAFYVPTTGFDNIQLQFDLRFSNTASRWFKLQYTLDSITFYDYTGPMTDSMGLYRTLTGDTWRNRIRADFSGVMGTSNNAKFGVRMVPVFAPGTSNFAAANPTSTYLPTGTYRFDMVTFAGNPILTSSYKLQILHSGDLEAGIEAVQDAPRYAAIIDSLEGTYANTLRLTSGDNFIPSPFLFSGEDPSLVSVLRSTASFYWPGNTNQLRASIGRPDIAIMNIIGFDATVFGNHEFDLGTTELNNMIGVAINSPTDRRWIGAQFPYLSANLNFSADANLNYLVTNQRLLTTQFKTDTGITNNNQKRGIAPSAIAMVNGEKIGLVGATTQVLQSISSPLPTTVIGPTMNDMPALAAILQPVIDSLRLAEGINKIIVLSHLQQLQFEEQLATLLRGVDIIIAGGNHSLFADQTDRIRTGDVAARQYPLFTTDADNRTTLIINMDANYRYVGRLVVDFDTVGNIIPGYLNPIINGAYAADSLGVAAVWGSANSFATGTKGALVRQICDAVGQVIVNKDGNIFGKTNVFLEGRRVFVRSQETNLGNITCDANLWYARRTDPAVRVSLKNGGGIRSQIGEVLAVGSNVSLVPPRANPIVNKQSGDISQLDIENSLRFNNRLWVVNTNAAGLRRLVEHGIAATRPGATPGQFPQVSGIRFSYDTTLVIGSKIRNMAIVDSADNVVDTIVFNGALFGDSTRQIKVVSLNFLVNGGDAYPFPTVSQGVLKLDTIGLPAGTATFTVAGSEQDAFAEYMQALFFTTPYNRAETPLAQDRRIQLLNARPDSVFALAGPTFSPFSLVSPSDSAVILIGGSASTLLNVSWNRSIFSGSGTVLYNWIGLGGVLNFPSNSGGQDTILSLPYSQIEGLFILNGVNVGDTANIPWFVEARVGTASRASTQSRVVRLVRGIFTGTPSEIIQTQVHLFPNPAQDKITLVNNMPELRTVKVMNMLGEEVFSTEATVLGISELDVTSLASGTYIIRLETTLGVDHRKFVIRK